MGEVKSTKKSWWKRTKGEFRKIVWPDKKSLIKQTTVVIFVSVFVGVIITVLDMLFKAGMGALPLK